jgi:hypothetical protein
MKWPEIQIAKAPLLPTNKAQRAVLNHNCAYPQYRENREEKEGKKERSLHCPLLACETQNTAHMMNLPVTEEAVNRTDGLIDENIKKTKERKGVARKNSDHARSEDDILLMTNVDGGAFPERRARVFVQDPECNTMFWKGEDEADTAAK